MPMPSLTTSLFLIMMALTGQGLAQDSIDIDQLSPYLSDRYTKGKYLLFDCYRGHWVCTSEIEFNACEKKREDEYYSTDLTYSCLPIMKLSNDKECHKKQYDFMYGEGHLFYCSKSSQKLSLN